jgi:hypothetical protein
MTVAELQVEDITLDYLGAIEGQPKLLTNLSAVAAYGEYLWTASDEGRAIECLKRDGAGYRLHDQIMLDDLCKELPKDRTGQARRSRHRIPADLWRQTLDLWFALSLPRQAKEEAGRAGARHARNAPLQDAAEPASVRIARVKGDGGALGRKMTHLPFTKRGACATYSVRMSFSTTSSHWQAKRMVSTSKDSVRCPRTRYSLVCAARSPAVSPSSPRRSSTAISSSRKTSNCISSISAAWACATSLAYHDGILILAGPVSGLRSPFRIYRREVQNAELLYPKPDHPS